MTRVTRRAFAGALLLILMVALKPWVSQVPVAVLVAIIAALFLGERLNGWRVLALVLGIVAVLAACASRPLVSAPNAAPSGIAAYSRPICEADICQPSASAG